MSRRRKRRKKNRNTIDKLINQLFTCLVDFYIISFSNSKIDTLTLTKEGQESISELPYKIINSNIDKSNITEQNYKLAFYFADETVTFLINECLNCHQDCFNNFFRGKKSDLFSKNLTVHLLKPMFIESIEYITFTDLYKKQVKKITKNIDFEADIPEEVIFVMQFLFELGEFLTMKLNYCINEDKRCLYFIINKKIKTF